MEVEIRALGDLEVAYQSAQKYLKDLLDQRDQSVEARTKTALDEAERQRSAGHGMDRFWKSYQEAAADNARTVENIMSQSFGSMEAGLARFTQTGKANFRDFTKSVISDAARMLQNALIKKLLSYGLGMLMGGGKDAGGPESGSFWYEHAKGGVMMPGGDATLRRYADGGVARSPQVSIFGEGTTPEAYVPLADGRTIPVTVNGASGSNMQSNVTVNIHSNGSTQVESSSSTAQAAEMGRKIEDAVRAVLIRERRSGGILA